MSHLPTSKIEALAGDVLTETFGSLDSIVLPVNLGEIAQRQKLTIIFGKFSNDNISGVYRKSEGKIYVSSEQGFPRKSFTIAHELGHHFLHKDLEQDIMLRPETADPEAQSDPREIEANKFAAALMMPRDLVTQYWQLQHSINDIATTFAASQTAATWRLRNLGLITD